jgi:peptidyl-Lys metalloendopeptidase
MIQPSIANRLLILAAIFALILPVKTFAGESSPKALAGPLAKDVSSTISIQPQFRADQPLNLTFKLKNNTNTTLYVLKWLTPLEGFNSNMFQIEISGEKAVYIGRTVKRAAPRPEDYEKIKAGETVKKELNLAEAYAVYKAGDYKVEYKSTLLYAGAKKPSDMGKEAPFKPKGLQSNVVSFKLVESREPPSEIMLRIPTKVDAKIPVFQNCSQDQQNQITAALADAEGISTTAATDLDGLKEECRPKAERYKTWFGAYSGSRYRTVNSNFLKIKAALVGETITFHCDCNDPYFAYVYPTQPYDIWLCNAFWPAPLTGTDSKAGTIVHEISHFNVVAGTDDHVYGQVNCQNLASNSPILAIENADSHEYFAENTPPISMAVPGECGLNLIPYSLMVIFIIALAFQFVRYRQRKI